MYEYSFKEDFIKDLSEVSLRRRKIITQIATRLTLTGEQARRNQSISDESVRGSSDNERRFRITDVMRIHYKMTGGVVGFLRLYDEGEMVI